MSAPPRLDYAALEDPAARNEDYVSFLDYLEDLGFTLPPPESELGEWLRIARPLTVSQFAHLLWNYNEYRAGMRAARSETTRAIWHAIYWPDRYRPKDVPCGS